MSVAAAQRARLLFAASLLAVGLTCAGQVSAQEGEGEAEAPTTPSAEPPSEEGDDGSTPDDNADSATEPAPDPTPVEEPTLDPTDAQPNDAEASDAESSGAGASDAELAIPAPTSTTCTARAREAAADSVVRVHSHQQWGAGFVYHSRRHVVTAFSLLVVGRDITVVARDGTHLSARLAARDEAHDLALLELTEDVPGATPLGPAPETSAAPGQPVVALGHPFATTQNPAERGLVGWTVAAGTVANVNEERLLADVALAVGNAGGPLLDCEGRLLGAVAGSGLLSADLGIASRASQIDPLLEAADTARDGDFFGNLRVHGGIGGALSIDEMGATAGGFDLTLGVSLFDRVSFMNRVGFFFGGRDGVGLDELAVDRNTVRIESLLGWRFFLDIGGFTTLYIVPAGGVAVRYQTDSERTVAVTPMCTPSDTESCIEIRTASRDQWIVRPAFGLNFIVGGNLEIGYTIELGLETPTVQTHHVVRIGLLF